MTTDQARPPRMPIPMRLLIIVWFVLAMAAGFIGGVLLDIHVGGDPYLWCLAISCPMMLLAVIAVGLWERRERQKPTAR